MEIRRLTPDEHKAADQLESLSFVFPLSEEKDNEQKPAYCADRWGYFTDAGAMSATITNHDLPLYFDGNAVAARGIAGVASDPVSRGKGNIRELLKQILTLDRENGVLFSGLYPFSHPFYRKFGYEICFEYQKATFPTESLKPFRTHDQPQSRLLNPADGTEALYPIYTAFARQFNFAIARDARTWQRIKFSDPYKAETICYVLSRGQQDTAYVLFKYRPQPQPFVRTLCLLDYAYVDIEAFYDILQFLYRFSAQAKDIEMFVPDALPLSSLFQESYDIEASTAGRPMARAVHVENVLKAMRHPQADGAYSVSVTDDFLPENTGCYRVAYAADGTVTVTRSEGEADLHLTVQTFTQLALGFLDLAQAAYKPDVHINGNEAVLRQVFVKKPVFLWDFY